MSANAYPVQLTIDYPDRPLNRLSSAFRIFTVIPILIVLAALDGSNYSWDSNWGDTRSSSTQTTSGGVGVLVVPVVLMILFRQKYPRWWYDWNFNLMSFVNRVASTAC